MNENILVKIFEHNNWSNRQIIHACTKLSNEQLDAAPRSTTKGSIRETLLHLVTAQQYYLSLFIQTEETSREDFSTFDELQRSVNYTGEALRDLVRDGPDELLSTEIQTKGGSYAEPWVILVQVINHSTEHREQISSMLTDLGVTPPDIDGWSYGDAMKALRPISS